MVTSLRTIAWDEDLVDELITEYEQLSSYINAHRHTDEGGEEPPELKILQEWITSGSNLTLDALV